MLIKVAAPRCWVRRWRRYIIDDGCAKNQFWLVLITDEDRLCGQREIKVLPVDPGTPVSRTDWDLWFRAPRHRAAASQSFILRLNLQPFWYPGRVVRCPHCQRNELSGVHVWQSARIHTSLCLGDRVLRGEASKVQLLGCFRGRWRVPWRSCPPFEDYHGPIRRLPVHNRLGPRVPSDLEWD